MAKNWTYNKENGTLTRHYTEKKVVDGKDVEVKAADDLNMDMDLLFDQWDSFEEVQKQVVINGLKQKLDDCIARSKDQKLTEKEKAETQGALAVRIFEDREWNMPSQAGARGPSVSLKLIVPALVEANFTVEAIAKMTEKTVETIQKFIDTGEEEEEN